jgi:hypothetical protein
MPSARSVISTPIRASARIIKANGNMRPDGCDARRPSMKPKNGDLVFTNFVDFDMLYGHRRDVAGYAAALGSFRPAPYSRNPSQDETGRYRPSHRRPRLRPHMAGHGPYTRKRVPIMSIRTGHPLASDVEHPFKSYADIGESIAHHLGIEARFSRQELHCDEIAFAESGNSLPPRRCATPPALALAKQAARNTASTPAVFMRDGAICLVRISPNSSVVMLRSATAKVFKHG